MTDNFSGVQRNCPAQDFGNLVPMRFKVPSHGGSSMRKMVLAFALVVAFASTTFAGPFGLFSRRTYNNGGNNTTYANNDGARFPVANAFLGSAQGVANHLASLGRGVFHMGGNPYAYEGVGMGVTPDQALRACCNNGGVVADYGVCQGANGMWYACKRYHGR